ncbi:hypothetical protein B7C42_05854 [Nocardia cerradoensis]|uniref:Uncharacterized protein n=1 Tax=Nocardia cerradoensis TaxID=85688 RepID=A0A231H073_9NOCA|nr:hypothetical protein B7C42_05854 [Nocardia cerradoensis]
MRVATTVHAQVGPGTLSLAAVAVDAAAEPGTGR